MNVNCNDLFGRGHRELTWPTGQRGDAREHYFYHLGLSDVNVFIVPGCVLGSVHIPSKRFGLSLCIDDPNSFICKVVI